MEAAATAVSIAWGSGEVPSTSGSLESGAQEDSESVSMEEEPGMERSLANIVLSPIQLPVNSSSMKLTELRESPAANLLCERLPQDGKQHLATIDRQEEEGMTVHAMALRRSTRATRYTQSMAEETMRPVDDPERVGVQETEAMGRVLYTKVDITEAEVIVTYNGPVLGVIITDPSEVLRLRKQEYTVVVKIKPGRWVKVDVRDVQTGKSQSFGGNASDGINAQGRKSYWNAQFEVDENDETLVNIVATRDIVAGELVIVWYGAEYWCNDVHQFRLKVMAIKTYNINILATAGKDGDW